MDGEAPAGTACSARISKAPTSARRRRARSTRPACATPDDGSVESLLAYADILRIFVLAPELPGALALIDRLTALGILPAAGHSSAKDEQVVAAMRVGLRHVTHIWSAMSSTVREGPWRKPGVLEAALASTV